MEDSYTGDGLTVVFESLGSTHGLEIIDPIERRRRPLHTPSPVSPTPADTEQFPFPVEAAVAIETTSITMPTAEQVLVRDDEGQMVGEVEHGETRTFPPGAYNLEPTGFVRVYVQVESEVSVGPDGHGTALTFGESTAVAVGCRSVHDQPAATITTTSDPEDVLAAISTFGSALKTTSPERAFASFRGHPPAVEVGVESAIPDGLEPPAEDVRIEVPPELRYAFPVAPLAYYLGAPVEPGPGPRIVGGGLDHALDATGSVADGVRRVLEQTFLLDCLTRTEGLYRVDLHEREVVESRVDLDFAALYDAPQPERLQAYLDVPHEVIADQIPDWRSAAHVAPTVDSVATLPYLVDDLALIGVAEPERVSPDVVETGGVEGLMRGGAASGKASATPAARGDGGAAVDTTFVKPGYSTGALEEAWVGDGTPIGATKAITAAYRNRIGRTASTGSIDISVICNADAMAEEGDVVDDVYGSRSNLPFDVTIHRDVTTGELADLLAEERDFLHYVGHIDDDGFECADGRLDASTLEDVGVDAFFLNACQSYEQGVALIEHGAIGGIVTIRDVVNFGAVRIGRAVARLLNCGFPLRSALEVAREESVMGSLYGVVGDGGFSIIQTASGTPIILSISNAGERYAVEMELFGAETGLGGLYIPHLETNSHYYLASGSTPTLTVDEEELEQFLTLEECPVRIDGQLEWSSDLSLDRA